MWRVYAFAIYLMDQIHLKIHNRRKNTATKNQGKNWNECRKCGFKNTEIGERDKEIHLSIPSIPPSERSSQKYSTPDFILLFYFPRMPERSNRNMCGFFIARMLCMHWSHFKETKCTFTDSELKTYIWKDISGQLGIDFHKEYYTRFFKWVMAFPRTKG